MIRRTLPENRAVLKRVFDAAQLRRVDAIAAELRKMNKADVSAPDIGVLSNASPNKFIDMVARVAAANHGARMGNQGASLQTAQMASGRVKALLGNLQNDKAEQLMMDAIEDPQLFRALLMEPQAIAKSKQMRNKLAPYFTGLGASFAGEEATSSSP